MQIQLAREELLKPVTIVAGVVERRQTLPILSYLLISANDGHVTITGTDLEAEIVTSATCEVIKPGDVTVPARKVFDICRALPEGINITLSKQSDKVLLQAGRSRFSLSTLPTTDFPKVEAGGFEQVLTIEKTILKKAIENTAFCMAQQDVRYYLNGLYLQIDGRKLKAVATDGHRMALTDVESTSGEIKALQVIVPRKGVQEISRLLGDDENSVRLEFGANHARLIIGQLVFTTKLIDGKFPDYTKVIPSNQTKLVQLNRRDFREALSRVAILANEKYRGIRLNLESGKLHITAHNPEQEEAVEEVETSYSGNSLEIGFNVNYLIEAVSALATDDVVLGLSDSNSSCTIQAKNDVTTQYIIMPMRL